MNFMAKEDSVLNLMLAHHAFIESLFLIFKDNLAGNSESAPLALADFKNQLKKHFISEEKAVFGFCKDKSDNELCRIVEILMKQHEMMLDMVNDIEIALSVKKETDSETLEKMLRVHRDIEEKELYPEIDERFSGPEKKRMIEEINKIVLEK
jgi:hemerythrin-like domain-containing protein